MERLEGVRVAEVDENRAPVPGTERYIPCDTLLLSVGLIPENELAREAGVELDPVTGGPEVNDRCMTNVEGIFSCGNALHVHDLVDWVSEEADRAGRAAAEYAANGAGGGAEPGVEVAAGRGVRYVMPDRICADSIRAARGAQVLFRVTAPSRDGTIEVTADGEVLRTEKHARLHPAEMVRVALGPADVEKLRSANRLEVRVQ
jgi:sarcosine oxidase subunit alpha